MKNLFAVIGGLAALAVCGCVALLVFGGGLAAVGGGSTAVSTSTTGSRPGVTAAPAVDTPFGQAKQDGDWQVQFTKTEKAKTLTWSTFGNKTDAKGVFIVAYLKLSHAASRNFSMNYNDWELVDSAGTRYQPSTESGIFAFVRLNNRYGWGEQVPPNTPVDAVLVWDVAEASTGGVAVLKATKTRYLLE